MANFYVVVSSAKMPMSCKGNYCHVAVIETDGTVPSRIDDRPKYVKRIVERWDRCNIGKTANCASNKAIREARTMCDELNEA